MSLPSASRRRTLALLGALPLALAGCGFQLRGPRPMPFDSIYLGMYEYSELATALKRQLRANGKTEVTSRPEDAQVRLEVLADTRSKVIMSLNALGKVREYQLNQRFRFRLVDKRGSEIIGTSELSLRRDLPYDDTQMLAKEQEEKLLYQDMQKDLIQQLLRRLATARMPGAPDTPPQS